MTLVSSTDIGVNGVFIMPEVVLFLTIAGCLFLACMLCLLLTTLPGASKGFFGYSIEG